MSRTTWSPRSYLTPLLRRIGLNDDGSTDVDVVISVSAGTTAPTTTDQPYVAGSVHAVGGSDPGLWQRLSSGWFRYALQAAAATFTNLTATGTTTLTKLKAAAVTELTIASGAITVTQWSHTVDTQSDASSDDLDTISGGSGEQHLVIRPASDARSVVLKHATGNIECPGGVDLTLAEDDDFAYLVWNGTKWSVLAYKCLADRATFGKFSSSEQTATGSAQNIAHGLGVVPSMVWIEITELPSGLGSGCDITKGAHDATNVVVTATSGVKYIAHAIR